ncbi:MAG TPA: UvrD-helicase domain-containing protein, partial [Candidatus Sulfopaludibacter sp.]|nr:UvrD-helicase domain-containing protein [Candidatus Sulfopaludibacter sp.]
MSDVRFTPAQLEAVDVTRRLLDTCIVAGPGSGKTTVLVEYFRRLVAEGVAADRILAITFTEKAAGNMRDRLAHAYRDQPEIRARLEHAWVSTVHGFCARLLRDNAVFAGVDPEFYVADERESWRLQQESIAAAMEDLFREHPAGVRALIRGLSSPEFEEAILSAYDAMRGAGVTAEQLAHFPIPPGADWAELGGLLRDLRADRLSTWTYEQKQYLRGILESAERVLGAAGPKARLEAIRDFSCNLNSCRRGNNAYTLVKRLRDFLEESQYALITEFCAGQRDFLIGILRRFDAHYRDRKRQAGALDFADLEEFAVRLLERDAVAQERIRAQFDHVLMDEFQDTNGQQARLLELVRSPGRFYAVGDINQSIFGFRHAEPRGFQRYRDEIAGGGGRLVDLRENFRSRDEILRAVETVMDGEPGIEARPLIAGREFETERPACVEAVSFDEPEQEAQWLARRAIGLSAEFSFREMAVLVRNTDVIAALAAAFDAAGVPYLVNRGRGFYEAREVTDLAHLLRVIANPHDELSLATVLRSPLVAVSDEGLLALHLLGPNLGAALLRLSHPDASQFDPADFARLGRWRDRLREWRARRDYVTFDRLLLAAIDECGYPYAPGSRAAANIDKFLAQARDASSRGSLHQFVADVTLVRENNPREPDAPPEDSADAVQVMTVHSAKGLEFPVVFVAALQKGVDAGPPVVAFEPRIGLGARWRNPAVREDKDDLVQRALRKRRKEREEQESNRLLYVAMTRAGQHLALSFSGKPANWAKLIAEKLPVSQPPAGLAMPRPDAVPHPDAMRGQPATAELLAPPAVSGQADTNATVTALAAFHKCPRFYYLGHYLGFDGRQRKLEDPAEGELSATELGTQVHALLAGTAVSDPDPEAARLADVFRKSALGRRAERARRIAREFDFLMAVGELVIHGQIDLWFEEAGELVIVDYKTDAVNGLEAHQRAGDYELQLRLYAAALEKAIGRMPDRACLHFLRPNTVIEVDLTPSLLDSPEPMVREFEEAQEQMAFPLNEGGHCRRCEFYHGLCPAGPMV